MSPSRTLRLAHMALGCVGILTFALAAGACSPGPANSHLTPEASEEAIKTPTPAPSPTPPLPAHIQDLELFPLDQPASRRVIGVLASDSSRTYTEISIGVSLLDAEGKTLSSQTVSPMFPHLLGGNAVPFKADFRSAAGAEQVVATPLGYRIAAVEGCRVAAKVTRAFQGEDGRTRVLGELVSFGSTAAQIAGLAVVARDHEGRLSDLSSGVISLAGLNASAQTPFLALYDFAPAGDDFEALVEAIQIRDAEPGSLVFEEAPRLIASAKASPFLMGSLRNRDTEARWASGMIWLSYKGEIVTLGEIRSPMPLAAGEDLAFSLDDLPGLLTLLRSDPQAAVDMEVRYQVDWVSASAPAPSPTTLTLNIDAFEAIGETLVLRGVVTNPTAGPVSSPTVFAAARTLQGKLIGAGWLKPAEQLGAGEQADLTLTLRLAEEVAPTDLEFDIRAFGVSP